MILKESDFNQIHNWKKYRFLFRLSIFIAIFSLGELIALFLNVFQCRTINIFLIVQFIILISLILTICFLNFFSNRQLLKLIMGKHKMLKVGQKVALRTDEGLGGLDIKLLNANGYVGQKVPIISIEGDLIKVLLPSGYELPIVQKDIYFD